jgi:multidrug efflux pump subunit AcrA (membrane-fusion protein)
MFSTRRIMFGLVLLGGAIGIVTVLGAAKLTGNGSDSKDPNGKKEIKDTSRGVVCIGTVDTENQQVSPYPDAFGTKEFPLRITKVLKKEGDKVKKGDVIAELDETIPRKMVDKAQAGVDKAAAQITQAKKAIEAHQYMTEVQQAVVEGKRHEIRSTEIKLKELRDLKNKNMTKTAEIDYDAAVEGMKGLEKGLEAEEKKLKGYLKVDPTSKLDEARAGLAAAQADLELAEELLKQMIYKAPIDGSILRSSVYEGFVFGPQMRRDPIVIQPTGKLFIRAEVTQEFAHRVAMNQKAHVYDYINTSLMWKGKVTRIADSYQLKRSNNNGSMELFGNNSEDPILEVWIDLEIDPKAPTIRQGQKVRVNLGVE